MRLKHIFLFVIIALSLCQPAEAKKKNSRQNEAWLQEMLKVKHDFLTSELNLTPQQQQSFFPLYDAMETEKHKLFTQTRELERQVNAKGDRATDAELDRAINALSEVKIKEGTIEKTYYSRFKSVLTKRQLFKLPAAERQFQRKMVKEHHKRKQQKK